jgi:hypothetical protein
MKRSIEHTGRLIALLLKRGGGNRARVSEATVCKLSGRPRLRSAFKEELRKELDDLGLLFVEIDPGGFGLQRLSTLNGAPALTAKKYMSDLKKLTIEKAENELEIDWLEDEQDAE